MLTGILGGVWGGKLVIKRGGLTLIMIHRIVTACDVFECNYSFEILIICSIFLLDDFIMLEIYYCRLAN